MKTNEWPLREFVTLTLSVIEWDGWLAKKDVKGRQRKATVDTVLYLLEGPINRDRYPELNDLYRKDQDKYEPQLHHLLEAESVISWAKNLTDEVMDKSSFHHNINQIAKNGIVQKRVAGIAAAMVNAYQEAQEKQGVSKR